MNPQARDASPLSARVERVAVLLLVATLAVATVSFALSDTSGLEADGQGLRLARTWAFLRTGDSSFLARWGEPIFDHAVPMPSATISPYPPLPGLVTALPLLLLGPGTAAQRVAMLLPGLFLVLSVARLGQTAHGRWGALLATGLLVGSPLLANALRQPCGEVLVVAACVLAATSMLTLARAGGRGAPGARLPPGVATGLAVGLALLCKWTAAPLLAPAALALAGLVAFQTVRQSRDRHAWVPLASSLALGGATVGLLYAAALAEVPRTVAGAVPVLLAGILLFSATAVQPSLALACGRALATAILVAAPWYAYAAPSIAEHVRGHVAMGTTFDLDSSLVHANLAVAVGLPFAALFLVAGALALFTPGRWLALVAWASAAVALGGALGAGRVYGFLNGEAQDRLLLPAVVALVLVAAAAARVPRVGAAVAMLAVCAGLVGVSSPGWAGRGQAVKEVGGALACGVMVEPRQRAYRWVLPGLAGAHPPLHDTLPGDVAKLLDALSPSPRPLTVALLADSGGCELGEGRLLALAQRGRIVSLAPELSWDERRAWALSRVGRVDEIVGWGPQAGNLVLRLAEQERLDTRRAPGEVVVARGR